MVGTVSADWVFTPINKIYLPCEGSTAIRVNKANSIVEKAPTARNLTYNGSAQDLVTEGIAEGGKMHYALGNATEATEQYTTSIPTATNAGTYYVWYKVVGDVCSGKLKLDTEGVENWTRETVFWIGY